jgi:hypothetical protein
LLSGYNLVPRVLLRTKLIPQIEDEEKNARVEQAVRSEQSRNPLPPPTVNKLDEGAVKGELRNWEVGRACLPDIVDVLRCFVDIYY